MFVLRPPIAEEGLILSGLWNYEDLVCNSSGPVGGFSDSRNKVRWVVVGKTLDLDRNAYE